MTMNEGKKQKQVELLEAIEFLKEQEESLLQIAAEDMSELLHEAKLYRWAWICVSKELNRVSAE